MCLSVFYMDLYRQRLQTVSGHPSERVLRRARFVFLNDGRFYMSGQKRIHFICFDAYALLSFRAIIVYVLLTLVIVSNRITCSLAFGAKVI